MKNESEKTISESSPNAEQEKKQTAREKYGLDELFPDPLTGNIAMVLDFPEERLGTESAASLDSLRRHAQAAWRGATARIAAKVKSLLPERMSGWKVEAFAGSVELSEEVEDPLGSGKTERVEVRLLHGDLLRQAGGGSPVEFASVSSRGSFRAFGGTLRDAAGREYYRAIGLLLADEEKLRKIADYVGKADRALRDLNFKDWDVASALRLAKEREAGKSAG